MRATCGTLLYNENEHLTHTLRATCTTFSCNENEHLTHTLQATCGTLLSNEYEHLTHVINFVRATKLEIFWGLRLAKREKNILLALMQRYFSKLKKKRYVFPCFLIQFLYICPKVTGVIRFCGSYAPLLTASRPTYQW